MTQDAMTTDTRVHPPLDRGRGVQVREPRWSPQWDRCWLCGTTELPHRGRGLCDLCYVRLRLVHCLPPLAEYIVEGGRNVGRWSRDHVACRGCGTTRRAHHARGLCTRCYVRWLRSSRGKPPEVELGVRLPLEAARVLEEGMWMQGASTVSSPP
ncbi:MAG: hypothetical protein ACUVXG_05075 [Anaerolineae bacterium]